MITSVSNTNKEVLMGEGYPTVIIGERINPTGKKKLAEALRAGNLDVVKKEAVDQSGAGADIIDINVSTSSVDEVSLLPQAVQAVMDVVDSPICIDSSNHDALEAALQVCKGKPIVNSVTGEDKSMEKVLPLIKRYGAVVVGLVQDDKGIPEDAEGRVSIARKIVERAEKIGIPREDVIIDCLVFAIGSDTASGPKVIEAISRIRSELGVNITMGASNVSFGLPDRPLVNNAFISMVIAAGATCLIADAAKAKPMVLAADLLMNRDDFAGRYIAGYQERQRRE